MLLPHMVVNRVIIDWLDTHMDDAYVRNGDSYVPCENSGDAHVGARVHAGVHDRAFPPCDDVQGFSRLYLLQSHSFLCYVCNEMKYRRITRSW